MIQKYKKIGLAAVACTLLGMNAAEAAVILTFAQNGPNVTATWSGTYLLPLASSNLITFSSVSHLSPSQAQGLTLGGYEGSATSGTSSPTGLASISGAYTGDPFGYSGQVLYFPVGSTGEFSPVGTMIFSSTTLAALNAAAFSNSLAFTGSGDVGGNREIRFQTAGVPEPTTGILSLLAVGGLTLRRRR